MGRYPLVFGPVSNLVAKALYISRLFLASLSLLGKFSLVLQIARRKILSTFFSIHYSLNILFFDALYYALFKA